MIDSLRLQNFRSFRDSGRVPLRPLTLIVGPNNAGKSTLLNAMLLLHQTLDDRTSAEPLTTSGPFVDLGSFDDIVRGGRDAPDRAFSIRITVPMSEVSREDDDEMERSLTFPTGNDLDLRFCFDEKDDRILLEHAVFRRDNRMTFGIERVARRLKPTEPEAYRARGVPKEIRKRLSLARRGFFPVVPYPQLPDGSGDWPYEEMRAANASAVQMQAWNRIIASIEHVAPLRQPVPRFTILGRTSAAPGGMATGGEALLQLFRTATRLRRNGRGRLVDLVDYWITQRFRLLKRLRIVDVEKAARVLALVADEPRGFAGINVANMGEGISQLLPIIASVLMLEEDGVLLVEQPEIHLHPAAQADLGDLLIAGVAERDRQLIVETHSEHLLLRIRRRIAEKKLDPDRVAVLYVDKPATLAKAELVPIDSAGFFENWPEGFFDEAYQEALQISLAASGD
jgi:predicted ATPase